MKVGEIMSRPVVSVSPSDGERLLERLVALGRLRHLPIIDDGRLVGMWLADEHGRLRMIGPEEIVQTAAHTPAEDAVADLLSGKKAVLVWDEGVPTGVLTDVDVLNLARAAMAQGIGRRRRRPVVIRLTGPEGGGKSLLALRTARLLHHCTLGIVQADDRPSQVVSTERLEGARVLKAPRAQFRAALKEALGELEDVQLVLVEDRADTLETVRRIGEDHQVLVLAAPEAEALGPDGLLDTTTEASALVVTKLDAAPEGFDFDALRGALMSARTGLAVIGVAAAVDDRGLLEWRDWLLARVLPARP